MRVGLIDPNLRFHVVSLLGTYISCVQYVYTPFPGTPVPTCSSPRWPGMYLFCVSVRIRAYSARIALFAVLLLGMGPNMSSMIVLCQEKAILFITAASDSTQHSITAPYTVHEHDKRSMLSTSLHVCAL